MGWLSTWFSADKDQYSRKGQALSSTHEAFSLPTSSPTFHSHPDAFNPEALHTPDMDSTMSPSYTYPPQGPGAYGYVPTSAGLNSRPVSASLLPTHFDPHHTPLSPSLSYPPLSSTWNRLRTWLSREYPELGDTLNYGILPQDLAQIEMQFGFALPAVIRESYLCVDGQEAESAAGCSEGLFFGLKLLPLEDVLEEWRFWREVDDDPTTGASHRLREVMMSIPPGWVRKEYSQRGWIPLIADKAGNYVGVDLNPGESGSVGQVIVFGRDFDTKVVLWKGDGPAGWAKWLASFVEELESGEGLEIGTGAEASDDSEDDLGYESYFYDGSGRGQGDGGGDTGSGGGLRYTGEYRGWNVLEAWADRSLRRWHEAGVITDTSLLPTEEDQKIADAVEINVLDATRESSAAVGIPVLADVDEPIPPPSAIATTHSNTPNLPDPVQSPPLDVPTISVTKAPAPRPVDLPMPHDIEPSSSLESNTSSFDEDLESGRRQGMREVSREATMVSASSSRRSKSQQPTSHENADASGSALAPSSPPTPSPPPIQPQTAEIPDLLADSAPAMDTKPIEPSSPASVQSDLAVLQEPIMDTKVVGAPSTSEPEAEAQVEEADPNTTIRLVGGGGIAGIALPAEDEEVRTDGETDTEVTSVTSAASESTTQNSGKKHKKTKSGLAGLKKLGNFGALRKRDSGSSTKGTSSPLSTAA